jgi:transaldolase
LIIFNFEFFIWKEMEVIMSTNPLRQLNALGQSVWQDNISRGQLLSGDLKRLIDQDGLSGVTSNPTIFGKAIEGSKDYDEAIGELARAGKNVSEIFDTLAVEDIQKACDLFRPTYDATQGRDGFVSIEVSPTLAYDTAGTISEARRLWRAVNRSNLMVKIPGTKQGLSAIEQMLSEGVNINITLLFAVEMYEQVANAYIAALETRASEGKPVDRVASVASFFVSRIDTLADQQLESRMSAAKSPGEREKLEHLQGKTAIANAKLAYRRFKEIFSGSKFKALAAKGARVQRVLWASTSTKNPNYRDILYAESLIGADTIDTMPPATIVAFRDHGQVRATLEEGFDEAQRMLAQLAEVGIDLRAVTQKLEDDGVTSFSNDFAKLLSMVEEKRKKVVAEEAAPVLGSHGS